MILALISQTAIASNDGSEPEAREKMQGVNIGFKPRFPLPREREKQLKQPINQFNK